MTFNKDSIKRSHNYQLQLFPMQNVEMRVAAMVLGVLLLSYSVADK